MDTGHNEPNSLLVRPYTPEDYLDLLDLHKSQNYKHIEDLTPKTACKIGFVAQQGPLILAMGFLRRLEGGYAQIDTLVSNGYLDSQLRHIGISSVVECLILEAKSLKLHGIIAFTQDEGVLSRAKDLGFSVIPQTIIGLSLD